MPYFPDDVRRREAHALEMASLPTTDPAVQLQPSPEHPTTYSLFGSLRPGLGRKPSEESIPVELCDGPVPEESPEPTQDRDISPTCSNRSELIERLKRGESPTWIPHRQDDGPRSPNCQHPQHAANRTASPFDPRVESKARSPPPNTPSPGRTAATRYDSPSLLPAPIITPEKTSHESYGGDDARFQNGMQIERPRSALHSGDFTQDGALQNSGSRHGVAQQERRQFQHQHLTNDQGAWVATSPPRDFNPFKFDRREFMGRLDDASNASTSPLSSSMSSSFVYKPPTSPLVQSESNDDIDLIAPSESMDTSPGMRNPRRHTLMSTQMAGSWIMPSPSPRPTPSLRPERTFPYQAHQPRKSLTSVPNFSAAGTSPQTPASSRQRRPSFGSDISPIHHAPMVGSYEESILRGRMSTTPSKPLEFLAQIGVLGLGKCKSSLRCPSHVTLPFPAVFYSYASASHGRMKMEDGPSPYVGQIDLENGLQNQEDNVRSRRKLQTRMSDKTVPKEGMMDMSDQADMETSGRDPRRAQRAKRGSTGPKAPPGGSYRIPEKGQIQIIIKNPNKTAVKLFLVPYDLAGMEPGTKTFIRQKSYSAGPIIENMPTSKDDATDRPILRYLVHLHICSPSKGRFYLYKSIRVVFANRVPDGKERLRNEIKLPDPPRFTPYKPIRVMHPPTSTKVGPGADLAADKAFRRRSSGFYPSLSNHVFDGLEELQPAYLPQHSMGMSTRGSNTPVEPIPFSFAKQSGQVNSRPGHSDVTESKARKTHQPFLTLDCSAPEGRSQTQQQHLDVGMSPPLNDDLESQVDEYAKLNKGDAGYGGNLFSGLINGNPAIAESLLSQRLRTMGVEYQQHQGQDSQQLPGEQEEYKEHPLHNDQD